MTKRLLYAILIITLILSFGVPFIFMGKNESINQTLNLSAALIGSISSILTFIIALLLYNKFGVESTFVEKSSSKIFELIEKIKETNFSISSDRGYFRIQMSNPFKYNKWIESYYSEKLVFADNYLTGLIKLFEISNNPFIPPSVSEKVERLQFFTLSYDVDETKIKEYSKVQVVGAEKIQNTRFGRFNMKDMTVFEFLKMLDEVALEIKSWIQQNSTIPVNLNL
ncbi:MAG TPA: hypothetical protein VG738_09080 [Chitinophagaceae bacterium]|nr:hypothetical protein [Chitinophagaceae bacterium]